MKMTSWNVEGRLTRFAAAGERGSPEQILEEIERLDSDVLFLPEAFDGSLEPDVEERLKELQYHLFSVPYNDRGDREDSATTDPHMMLLSRHKIINPEIIPMVGGIRNMMMAHVISPQSEQKICVFGIHFDDRSEENRLKQVDGIVSRIAAEAELPIIAMGDFNAMHGDSAFAHFLGNPLIRFGIRFLPTRRLRRTARHLSEMAIGETLQRFEALTGLIDTDTKRRPTTTPKMRGQEWMPSIRMAQIDHVYRSSSIVIDHFRIAADGGSDHRAISVTTRQKQ